jgi:transcriptional regulator GlxA family with amidase domain
MNFPKLIVTCALCVTVVISLSGCDMAEQAAQELAAKAEQSAKQMARETVQESVNALNQQVDQAQKATETWLEQTPAEKPQEPKAPASDKSVTPAGVIET